MKVYTCPAEVVLPETDFHNYDFKKRRAEEEAHCEQLKAWLVKAGYTGKRTGDILRVPRGDGYAQYMLADGRKSCLIHLPYGDAWDSPDVQFLPKAEVLRRIDGEKKLASIFARKEASK